MLSSFEKICVLHLYKAVRSWYEQISLCMIFGVNNSIFRSDPPQGNNSGGVTVKGRLANLLTVLRWEVQRQFWLVDLLVFIEICCTLLSTTSGKGRRNLFKPNEKHCLISHTWSHFLYPLSIIPHLQRKSLHLSLTALAAHSHRFDW